MENTSRINPKMLSLAMASRAVSSDQLAADLGITRMAVWYWENGQTAISDDLLAGVSKALNYPESFFLQPGEALPLPMSYRKRGKVNFKQLNQIDANANIFRLNIDKLMGAVQYPPRPLPILDVNDLGSPEACARELRKIWNLKNRPIANLSELLEAHYVFLLSYDLGTNSVAGRCTLTQREYPLILTNRTLLGDRQRFTLAYHLGYFVMHLYTKPAFERDISHEANLFAAEFLMPKDGIITELQDLDFNKLPNLKRRWGVSMISLLYRAEDLNCIDAKQKKKIKDLFKERNILEREPQEYDIPTEQYKYVRDLLTQYRLRQGFSLEELAAFFHLKKDDFLERYNLKV